MRLTTTLLIPAISTLFASASGVGAYMPAHRRNKHPSHALASRQYHMPRDLLNICVFLDATFLTTALAELGVPSVAIDTSVCLCLQDLDLFLEANTVANIFIDALGTQSAAFAYFNALIRGSDQRCIYPPHSQGSCAPCEFQCIPPYIRDGDNCVCPLPNMVCNDQCVPAGSCGSAVPRSPRVHPDHVKIPFVAKCIPPYIRDGDNCVCPLPNMVCNGQCVPAGSCGSAPRSPRVHPDHVKIPDVAKRHCRNTDEGCGIEESECVDTNNDPDSCAPMITHPNHPAIGMVPA